MSNENCQNNSDQIDTSPISSRIPEHFAPENFGCDKHVSVTSPTLPRVHDDFTTPTKTETRKYMVRK